MTAYKAKLDPKLIKHLHNGNVVLWWGWSQERISLVKILAEKSRYPGLSLDFLKVGTYFIHEAEKGRPALIDLLKDASVANDDITLLSQLLLFPIRQIISPRLDDQVERALRVARKRFMPITEDVHLPYSSRPEYFLIKPYGSLVDPKTLVLTEEDYRRYFMVHPGIVEFTRSLLTHQTWLCVNEDMEDPYLKQIFFEAKGIVGDDHPPYYALNSSLENPKAWRKFGIELLSDDLSTFITTVSETLASITSHQQSSISGEPSSNRPYKFLDFFTAKDRDMFFGRDDAIQALFEQIVSSRLTVLFGHSGVGKTSLLLAGVIPKLEATDFLCLYVSFFKDPVGAIKQELLRFWDSIKESGPPNPNLPLPEYLVETSNRLNGKKLVILVDQFEEFGIRLSRIDRRAFAKTVGELLHIESSPVRLVFSIREDFLGVLDELQPAIFKPLANTYRLTNLEREGAKNAIEQPVIAFEKRFDVNVVEHILDSLIQKSAEGREEASFVEKIDTREEVFPPYLQIVCYQIFEALPKAEAVISWPFIQNELGGVEKLLNEYLQATLATLDPEDQEPARKLLKDLVSSAGTKALKHKDEFVGVTDLTDILNHLVTCRLVRRILVDDGEYYELAHDQLIDSIKSWINIEEQQAKFISEMLTQEVINWYKWNDEGEPYIIDISKLKRVYEQRDNPYLDLNNQMQKLLLSAALHYNHEIDFWMNRMEEDVQGAVAVVRQALIHSDVGRKPLVGLSGRISQLAPKVKESLIDCFKQLLRDIDRINRIKAAYALWQFRRYLAREDLLKIIWVMITQDVVPQSAKRIPRLATVAVISTVVIVVLAGILLLGGRAVCQSEILGASNAICQLVNPVGSPITIEVPVEPTPIQPLKHEMVQIPAGDFIFGTDGESTENSLDTYHIDKFEVTNAQYTRCVQAEICSSPVNSIFSSEKYQQHPVTDISLEDAQRYCNWIGGYLPSELQWEKAARGTEGFEYPWGNEPLQEGRANICDAQCTEPLRVEGIDDGFPKTAPVGSFPSGASPFSVEDMVGNVWEWTSEGVARGGSWQNDRRSNKAISRVSFDPQARDPSLGFRCVRSTQP